MATLHIEIPDEQAAALKAFAQARGVTVEQWLMQVVEQTALAPDRFPSTEESVGQHAKRFIWDVILERMKGLPHEAFENLPDDGASQHDHYIYGLPKRDQ